MQVVRGEVKFSAHFLYSLSAIKSQEVAFFSFYYIEEILRALNSIYQSKPSFFPSCGIIAYKFPTTFSEVLLGRCLFAIEMTNSKF